MMERIAAAKAAKAATASTPEDAAAAPTKDEASTKVGRCRLNR